jgi:hypothetical protein
MTVSVVLDMLVQSIVCDSGIDSGIVIITVFVINDSNIDSI